MTTVAGNCHISFKQDAYVARDMFSATSPTQSTDEPVLQRQRLMRICAMATEPELAAAMAQLVPVLTFEVVRAPQVGLVMVRGRIGGSEQPFNLGEATVTRASVQLPTGEMGHAYLLGRDLQKSYLAAAIDAAGQNRDYAAQLEDCLITPVSHRISAAQATRQSQTEATRVNFFTLVRGEDAR
jgi:alpha-D-ribose 1-methylphosphonate 5-triphosphate synthase subunit PhnG